MNLNQPNLNLLWATLIVEELIRNGVDYFCISPGSRSAPLTIAIAQNKKTVSLIHCDERGSAFHALGYSAATGKPCAVVTTSGSALGNLFPAVIEASKKKVPLILLTADRPPELRFTGANQTIDQVKFFGEYVRWSFDLPTPTKDIPPQFLLTTCDQLVARSQGELKGPVHLNCMFREPLEPLKTDKDFTDYLKSIKEWSKTTKPYTRYIYSQKTIGKNDLDDISTRLNRIKKGIIIVGKIKELDQKSILSLSEKLKWPIFPDISSGFRIQNNHKHIISSFDSLLLSDKFKARNQIDGILHLGGRITSKRWYEWIKKSFLNEYIMVLNHPLRNDPFHNVSLRVQSPVGVFCQKIIPKIALQKSSSALKSWQDGERRLQIKMKNIFNEMRQLNEPLVARLISEYIPVKTALFLSSSMPIRTMDQYAYQNNRDINIGANRGASGIDGVIASACGFSKGLKKRVTLLIGDLAFCYDMNSLMMLKDLPQAMTIILINNNGGGIFNLLPIAQYKDVFEKYFAGPHNLEFSQLAMNFGLNYHSPDSIQKFIDVYQQCMLKKNSSLIEIKIERTHNTEIINEIQRKLIRFY